MRMNGASMAGIVVIIVIFLVSAGTCRSQAEKEIDSVLAGQASAWNKGDIEGYMQGYWKSDSLLFTSGGNIQRGWKATLEKYRKNYSTKSKMGILKFSGLEC